MANNKYYGYTPKTSKGNVGVPYGEDMIFINQHPFEFQKGMDYELTDLGCARLAESTLEEREKATESVFKNLETHPSYYSNLIQYEVEYRNPVEGIKKPSFKAYLKEMENYQMIEVDKKYTHDKMIEPKYNKEEYTVSFKTQALKEAIKREIRSNFLNEKEKFPYRAKDCCGSYACPSGKKCDTSNYPYAGHGEMRCICRDEKGSDDRVKDNSRGMRENKKSPSGIRKAVNCCLSWPVKDCCPIKITWGKTSIPSKAEITKMIKSDNLKEAKKAKKDEFDVEDAEPTRSQIKGIDKSIGDAKEALVNAMQKVKELGPDIKKLAKETNAKIKKNPAGKTDYLQVYASDPDVKEFLKLRKMLKSADLL